MHLQWPDYFILALYLLGVCWVGFRAARSKKASEERVNLSMILGTRRLTLPAFVMSLASTWYGGVLGVGEFSYSYGVSNWTTQALPYYVFSLLFAWLLVPKIWNAPSVSLSEQMNHTHGSAVGKLAALFIFLISSPAPYILIVGVLLELVTGWPLWLAMLLGTLLSSLYLAKGGFDVDVKTDQFEFIWMYGGFIVLVGACFFKLGGVDYLIDHIPSGHWSITGGMSFSFLLVWFLTAFWTLIDPSFFQRCKAAGSVKQARVGIVYSVLCWMVFDFLTLSSGLYAKALLPNLEKPMYSLPILGDQVLGSGFKGVFFVGMLATVMSTLNSMVLVSSQSLMKDMFGKASQRFLSMGIWASALIGFLTALWIPSVVQLWYAIGNALVPGLLLPMLMSYFFAKRASSRVIFISMVLGVVTSSIWLILGWQNAIGDYNQFPLGLQPMFAGFLASALVLLKKNKPLQEVARSSKVPSS